MFNPMKLDWNKLGARERDVMVATAFGWKSWPYVVINGERRDFETWLPPHFVEGFNPDKPFGGCAAGQRPPSFTTDIKDAWAVVERMGEKGFGSEAGYSLKYFTYRCCFDSDSAGGYAEADTAPEAICLAALRAMGVEV